MAKTLEQSFERLEEIIAQMEKSDTTLDASFKMYQEGMKLVITSLTRLRNKS